MTEKNSSIKHLKLVTGEELICELLSETKDSFIVRNALSLMPKTMNDGSKYYAFKTFMVYQDTPLNVILIFSSKIMSIAVPTEEMIQQYSGALKEMAEYMEEDEMKRLDEDYEEPMSLDDFLDEMDLNKKSDCMDSDVSGMAVN